MAKQSWKDQLNQQIANSQVQQVIQQQRDQDFQLAQNLIAQFQPNNDDLALAQSLISQYKPQQTAPVQPVSAAPKQQFIPSLRQEGVNRAVERRQRLSKLGNTIKNTENKETVNYLQRENYQREQQKENALASTKPKDNRTANQIVQDAIRKGNEGVQTDNIKNMFGNPAPEGQNSIKNMLQAEIPSTTNTVTPNPEAERQAIEVQNAIESVSEDAINQYAQKRGISVDAAKAEVEGNIRNAIAAKYASIESPGNTNDVTQKMTQQAQANSAEKKRLAAQRQYTPYEAWGLATGKAVSDVVNGPVYLAGKVLGTNWDLYSDRDRERYAQSKEQHPTASGLGTMSGMALAGYAAGGGAGGRALASEGLPTAAEAFNATQGEALLNGASKTEALLRGLGTAGRQTLKNAGKDLLRTDLATDIIPTLANDIAEGKSAEEVALNTALNTGMNIGFNSFGDIASLASQPLKNIFDNGVNNVSKAIERTRAISKGYDYDYKGVPIEYNDKILEPEKLTYKLTGEQVSPEFATAVRKLDAGEAITSEEYNAIPEIAEAKKRASAGEETIKINTPERLQKREQWRQDLNNYGSAEEYFDPVANKMKVRYTGSVERGHRADIVIGLPSSGKSSAVVDPISFKYKSKLLDSDEAKKLIDEFNDGWGAGNVHEESKAILANAKADAFQKGENVVLPIVGHDYRKLKREINLLKNTYGYEVHVHLNELDANKAAGRNLRRLANEGRFLDLDTTSFDYGNRPSQVFELMKREGIADGYTRVSNDVKLGDNPVQLEGTEDINFNWRNNGQGGRTGTSDFGAESKGMGSSEIQNSAPLNGGNDYGTDNTAIQPGAGRNINGAESSNLQRSGGMDERTGEVGRGNNRVPRQSAVNDVTPELRQRMDSAKIRNVGLKPSTDVNKFSAALDEARKYENNTHGVFVSPKSPEEIQGIIDDGGKALLSDDGTSGVIITADGDIEGVFYNKGLAKKLGLPTKGAFDDLMLTAIANGGKKLDCYGDGLGHMYARMGMEPVVASKYIPGKEWSAEMDAWKASEAARKGINADDINTDVYVFKLRDGWTVDDVMDAMQTGSLKEYADNLDLSLDAVNKNVPKSVFEVPEDDIYMSTLNYRDSLMKQPETGASFNGGDSSDIDLVEKGSGEDKISKYRTNSMNKLDSVNEQNSPTSDYGYNNFSVEEQTIEGDRRWGSNPNAIKDLLGKENWDEVDARYAQRKWTELMEAGEVEQANRMARRMSYELREGGRLVQTAAEMDDIASQLNEARRMINSRVDKMGGVGTSEALDNFATKAESRLDNINLSTKEGKDKAADVMAEMMSKDMKTYAPTNKAMTSKQFRKANKIISDIKSGKLKTKEDIINEVYKQNGSVPIEAENQKKIYDLLNSAKNLEDGSREQEIVLARAAKLATKNVPTTFGEKARGVLYMNMLGNFKTAISRNAFGNLGYQVLEQARSPFAAGVDWLTSKATGKHSELGWNKEKFKAYGRGLKKGAKDQAGDFVSGLNTGRSGSLGWAEALKNNKGTFNYRGDSKVLQGLSDIANKAEFYVENAMKFGDRPFFEANYQQRKTEIYQLLNRYGKENVAGFSAIPDSKLEDTIDMVASVHAADSVFQKQGKISKGLTDLRNGLGEVSEGTIGVDLLSTAASPFTLTPGNMLEKAVEYSPFGAVKNAVETAKELRQGKFNQRRFVDEASRTLTGIPILAATYGLAKKGVINGGYSDDYDEKAAQQEDGFIEYGLNLPNGRTYDTSDIPVVGPFMQAGAAVAEDGVNAKSLLQGASAITAGSTMQGLRRAFGADNGFGSTSSVENLIDTIKSSGTQLVPSLLRQTAQTTDAYKRDLGEYGTNEYYLNAIKNSVPGFRQTLPVKTDVEGRPILQNQGRNIGSKILENYLLPMNVSEYNPSPLNAEASRLLDTTDSAIAFVPKAKRSDLRDWDEKAGMEYSEEQFRTYKEELGKLNSELGNALIQSDFYANLDDKDKAKKLQAVYSAMKAVAKKNATGIDTDDTIANAYIDSDGNIESVINHIQGKDIVKGSGLSTSNKAAKQAQELANNGDIEGAQEVIDQKLSMNEALEAHGYDKNSKTYQRIYNDYGGEAGLNDLDTLGSVSAFYSYQGAKDEAKSLKTMKIPSIEDYAKTYSKIDSYGNKNGSVTQKEMASYLNAGNYTLEQATDLAILYGDWDKAPHIIKSGKNKGKWGF